MRRWNGLLTSIVGCLTVAFVVFNKTAFPEPKSFSLSKTNVAWTLTEIQNRPSSIRTSIPSHRYVTPSLTELGGRHNIPEMSEDTLMITRLPGAGAELLVLILQRLQGLNAFKHVRMPPGDENLLTSLQQGKLFAITHSCKREFGLSVYLVSTEVVVSLLLPTSSRLGIIILVSGACGLNFEPIFTPDDFMNKLNQELLVEDITTIIRREAVPLTFDADLRFLNFSTFGRQAPTFISMVRDPLDPKMIRRYRKNDRMSPNYSGSIAYFCGQDPRCTQGNRTWALEEAQDNVKRWYPVVGLLEHVEVSLETLERKFPYFFKGATEVYNNMHVRKDNEKKFRKSKIDDFEEKLLRGPLAEEMEFYLWLKARLVYPRSGNG